MALPALIPPATEPSRTPFPRPNPTDANLTTLLEKPSIIHGLSFPERVGESIATPGTRSSSERLQREKHAIIRGRGEREGLASALMPVLPVSALLLVPDLAFYPWSSCPAAISGAPV